MACELCWLGLDLLSLCRGVLRCVCLLIVCLVVGDLVECFCGSVWWLFVWVVGGGVLLRFVVIWCIDGLVLFDCILGSARCCSFVSVVLVVGHCFVCLLVLGGVTVWWIVLFTCFVVLVLLLVFEVCFMSIVGVYCACLLCCMVAAVGLLFWITR